VIQVLDKQHDGFKVLLESIDANRTTVIQEGATSSTITTRKDETNMTTTRQEWMAKVPRLGFWRHEPHLVPIVRKLFDEQKLDDDELQAVRRYVQSWITWTGLIPEDPEYVAFMEELQIASQQHLMTKTVFRLMEYGIDPF
jgi:hypothetical protein